VPPRRFAADGSLRECRASPGRGPRRRWRHTSYGGTAYGLLDLDSGTRIQVRLLGDARTLAAPGTHGVRNDDGTVVFNHE